MQHDWVVEGSRTVRTGIWEGMMSRGEVVDQRPQRRARRLVDGGMMGIDRVMLGESGASGAGVVEFDYCTRHAAIDGVGQRYESRRATHRDERMAGLIVLAAFRPSME